MSARSRLLLALLWLGLLLLAGWALGGRLQLTGDLRKFMPEPRTSAQKLLIEELGEGPGSRLLLMSISGADPATLARQSQALRERLAGAPQFELFANGGDAGLGAIAPRLRPYRYLLSDSFDATALDADFLRGQLEARVQDLGSPAAALVEPLIGADPSLETLKLAASWQPSTAPQQIYGVWFDRAGNQALLLAQTSAAGFDPGGQQAAIDAIRTAFAAVRGNDSSRLDITGPGAFSVEIGGRTQREASWIGSVDTLSLILLLWIAYGSWKAPLLGVLPLASAGLAGLGAVAIGFPGGVHGITVAFGFTLIGVAQDYPIHLFSHQRAGLSPRDSARTLWPTLATGLVSTCIAYVTFLASGVDGLRQLAVFTIVGLATAALATRFLLPSLMDPAPRDAAASPRLARLWTRIERLPRPRVPLALLALVALAVVAFAPTPFWQNDLSKLTPVPTAALLRDAQLRSELGAPDVRYLVMLQAPDSEQALQAVERLRPVLDALVQRRAIAGYDSAVRYLPSAATQRARQARLPDSVALQASLDSALVDSPFRADAFEAFVADVAAARQAPPLRPQDLVGTPLAVGVDGLLLHRDGHATALVSLRGLEHPDEVASTVRANGAELMDLKQASESLVADYRGRVLLALAVAALLLAATVWIALRDRRRTIRVLLPMAMSTLLVLALLRGLGVELNLFHLVALILGAGLGLDYALFFDHAGDDRAEQLRTLHAVIVCSLTMLLVFALLALSSIPVLRAIGVTVALSVVANFVLALLIARAPTAGNR
ncbi:MAG: MMPL family transporter, partial [Luteimonas sp.]